jgi:hypothetical protein
MKTHVIHVDPFDDVNSIKDKMNWCTSDRILLVVPDYSQCCQKKLDLVLLLRHSCDLGAQLGFVTANGITMDYARQLKIPVYTNAAIAQRRIWHATGRPPRILEYHKKAPLAIKEEVRKNGSLKFLHAMWFRVSSFSLGLMACLVIILLFLPRATIILPLQESIESVDITVRADPGLTQPDVSGGLPVITRSILISGSFTADATGEMSLAETYATGTLTITNLTDQAIVISPGMMFGSSSFADVTFSVQKEVVLPAGVGSVVSVPVKAVIPGTAGNVPAADISLVLGTGSGQILSTNQDPTTGGKDVNVSTPARDDIEKARHDLLDQLSQDAIDRLSLELNDGEKLIEQSLVIQNINSETVTPQEGKPADQFTISMSVDFSALAYDEAALENLGKLVLAADVPVGQSIKDDSFYITQSTTPVKDSNGKLSWKVTAAQILHDNRDPRELIYAVLGKGRSEAFRIIASGYDVREDPQIILSPSFWTWLPLLPFQVKVEVK